MAKEYLGDGVYVDHHGSTIILATENGQETTNMIFLDSEIWQRLEKYIEKMKEGKGRCM